MVGRSIAICSASRTLMSLKGAVSFLISMVSQAEDGNGNLLYLRIRFLHCLSVLKRDCVHDAKLTSTQCRQGRSVVRYYEVLEFIDVGELVLRVALVGSPVIGVS